MRYASLSRVVLRATVVALMAFIGIRYVPQPLSVRLSLRPPRPSAASRPDAGRPPRVLTTTPTAFTQSARVREHPSVRAEAWSVLLQLFQRFRLRGTVLGDPPLAFIEDTATGAVDRYRLHDALGAARITRIQRASVRLTHQGREMSLLFDGSSARPVPADLSPRDPDHPTRIRAQDPAAQVSMAFVPRFSHTSGEFVGLAVEAINPARRLARLGLEPGDVIVTVNGQRLESVAQTLQVLKKAWRQDSLSLELLRGEQRLARSLRLAPWSAPRAP